METRYRLLKVEMPASQRAALEAELRNNSIEFLLDGVNCSKTTEKACIHYVFRKSVDIAMQSRLIQEFSKYGIEFFSFQDIDEAYALALDGEPGKPGRFKRLTGT